MKFSLAKTLEHILVSKATSLKVSRKELFNKNAFINYRKEIPAFAGKVISKAGPGSIVVFHDSVKASKRMQFALAKTMEHFSQRLSI